MRNDFQIPSRNTFTFQLSGFYSILNAVGSWPLLLKTHPPHDPACNTHVSAAAASPSSERRACSLAALSSPRMLMDREGPACKPCQQLFAGGSKYRDLSGPSFWDCYQITPNIEGIAILAEAKYP